MKGTVLKQFTLGMGSLPGIFKSESLGQETDQPVADFSQGNWELQKKLKSLLFWLDCAIDFGSF